MEITTALIKELRDHTGLSIMQVKKALEEAKGDKEKALALLKKKSGDISAKKADRTLGAGVISSYIHSTGTVGTMVELSCETDFVAKNPEFMALARDIAMHVAATNPLYLSRADISDEEKAKMTEVFEADLEGKPANLREKIMEGKLEAFFSEKTLLDQPFIKNEDVTIQEMLDGAVQKFGEKTVVARFTRFSVLGK